MVLASFTYDFFESSSKISGNESLQVNEFILKFFNNPMHNSIELKRLDGTRSDNIWRGKVNRDLRVILYKDCDTWLFLHIDHHDNAYKWAEKKLISRNKITGEFQIVNLIENIQQVIIQEYVSNQPSIFDKNQYSDEYLLSLGIPELWLPSIRQIKTDEQLDKIFELPEEVAERLLQLASGEFVTPPMPIPLDKPLMEIPGATKRFYIAENNEELQRILEAPLQKWVAFLHPSQRKLAIGEFNGPVKVTGTAGTGKTVVAMHRAKHFAKQGKKVLITSFVGSLCENIKKNLKLLCTPEEYSLINVVNIHKIAKDITSSSGKQINILKEDEIKYLFRKYYNNDSPLNFQALLAEWSNVIQANNIDDWEKYRDFSRIGRGKPLTVKERKIVWKIFKNLKDELKKQSLFDWSEICKIATDLINEGKYQPNYDAVIVDEVQDFGIQEIKFIAALSEKNQNNLMLVGDAGQRIYRRSFSLKSLGIDVVGRSTRLKINYRTTKQIKKLADFVIGDNSDDLDGGQEARGDTFSLLKGPEPILKDFLSVQDQYNFVISEIQNLTSQGLLFKDIAVFARINHLIDNFSRELINYQIPFRKLEDENEESEAINIGNMYRAKGLEFKVIFIIDANENILPLASVIKDVQDPIDLENLIAREKSLFYVSLTRARDELFVTWVDKPTKFLEQV
jgi:mRNA-degrading endonuclease RelE of RelBE toxin-antitoxin system/thymidine kinase